MSWSTLTEQEQASSVCLTLPSTLRLRRMDRIPARWASHADPRPTEFIRQAFRTAQIRLRRGYAPSMSSDIENWIELGYRAYERGESAQAARWWRMAAIQRSAEAMINLGLLADDNPTDREQMLQWFYRAAQTGSTDGMIFLSGALQEQGDVAEAREWLRKAAELGNSEATVRLEAMNSTPRRMQIPDEDLDIRQSA